MKISPLAVVDPKAILASDVEVGPFCVIGPDVVIDSGTKLLNNVTVAGHTRIGKNNAIFPNAVIGQAPQDRKYKGGPTRVEIGSGNMIREAATIHLGTEKGGGVTRVGNNNLLMVNAHVGHDAKVGNGCTIANNCMLAGHVEVGDFAVLSGAVGVHHFVTIGEHAFIGGCARIHHDVPPFLKVDGADVVRGINKVGLKRAGFTEEDVEALEEACRDLFYRDKPLAVAMADYEANDGANRQVRRLIEFLRRRDQGIHGRYLEGLRTT